MNNRKVIILGSGPAGCSAAIYAARANLEPLLIHGEQPGGQLTITTDVENYPGFADPVMGPDLMNQMIKQAENVGTEIVVDHVISASIKDDPIKLTTSSGTEYSASSLIIATGAQAKWLGLESEDKFKGYGVSGCATCDGFFYKNKIVAVIGGGNTAVEEALYLTHHASKVYLIHRRDSLRAEKILQKRLFDNPKIEVVWDSVLNEVKGSLDPKSVDSIQIKNVKTGDVSDIKLEGVFIAIGHKPNTDLFKGQINMDNEGYIITKPGTTETSIRGVYASGDVQDKIYRQAVTAAGTGCMAALEVEKFLSQVKL